MECRKEENREFCNCTYESCSRKGLCCECIRYHVKARQLPACVFPPEVEATYDRSFERFARLVGEDRI
ncbi:MAG: cytosolic protein [Candidatus Altiarchaeales archaeon]|nr:cytosolic protein [Candidatus Altiarchaeales archaeon]